MYLYSHIFVPIHYKIHRNIAIVNCKSFIFERTSIKYKLKCTEKIVLTFSFGIDKGGRIPWFQRGNVDCGGVFELEHSRDSLDMSMSMT